jgi:flagellar protein FlaJ
MTNGLERWAYRSLGGLARAILSDRPRFDDELRGAGVHRRPDMFVAVRLVPMLALALVGVLGLGVLGLLDARGLLEVPDVAYALLATALVTTEGLLYAWTFAWPRVAAFMRAEAIDDNLPFVVNYMAAMAQADVPPERLFESLAGQDVYGELSEEASIIERDVSALGQDLVTALAQASDRSPSTTFSDFLDGAITSITAGGSLDEYLEVKADQYMDDRRQDQTRFLDNLGILAESYVTVGVAGPMFVIVLLSVMVLFGTQGDLPLQLGYVLMLLLVPLVNAGFVVAVETIAPKV